MRRILLFLTPLILLIFPAAALADPVPVEPHSFAFPPSQIWALLAGALVALPTYLINKFGPHTSNRAKSIVHLITATIAGAITQAVAAGHVGFNSTTLQFIAAAVFASAASHSFWERSEWGPLFGQGQNAPTK